VTVTPGADDEPIRGAAGEPPADQAAEREGGAPQVPGEPSDTDVDAAFAAIVSGIAPHMRWTADHLPRPGQAADQDQAAAGPGYRPPLARPAYPEHPSGRESADERARRRELRRLERAMEVEAYQAQKAAREAELAADDAHYTPPEPPPLPRPKGRTIGAVLLMAAGILLVARPGLLSVGPDLVLILALALLVSGAGLLVAGMRRQHGNGDGDGEDDGAVV
jgi:hypothetical protein